MAPSCKLELARFSGKLRIQDGAECRYFILKFLIFIPEISDILDISEILEILEIHEILEIYEKFEISDIL